MNKVTVELSIQESRIIRGILGERIRKLEQMTDVELYKEGREECIRIYQKIEDKFPYK